MSDQEGAAQPVRDEREQQQSRQPERAGGAQRGDRDRGRRSRHGQQNPPRRAETQLPMEELRDLFALFTEHGLTEFELERESFRVHLGRNQAPQVVNFAQGATTQLPASPVEDSTSAEARSAAS